jgi:hypothetical protein
MDERIKRIMSPKDCETFARNATERARPDLAIEARQRAVELRAAEYGEASDAERECLRAVYAYEEVLSVRNGKRTRASRTWQMIRKHGIIAATERAVDRSEETAGFSALQEVGLGEYAFEAVILRHPELFSATAVQRSEERMKAAAD